MLASGFAAIPSIYVIGCIWYGIISVVRCVWFPKPGRSFLLSIAEIFAILLMLVSLDFFFLGYFAGMGLAITAFFRNANCIRNVVTRNARITGITIASVAMAAIVTVSVPELLHPKSTVDKILLYERTGVEVAGFSALRRNGAAAAPDYRRILKEGKYFSVTKAAEELMKIGPAQTGYVIDALERMQKQDPDYYSSNIEKVLRTYTKLDLPEKSPASAWRKAWNEKSTSQPTRELLQSQSTSHNVAESMPISYTRREPDPRLF